MKFGVVFNRAKMQTRQKHVRGAPWRVTFPKYTVSLSHFFTYLGCF